MNTDEPRSSPVVIAVTSLLGLAAMAYGVFAAFDLRSDTHPFELTRWVIGLDIVHDVLLIPLVGLVGVGLARVAPVHLRRFVRWAALTTGVLALIAWPFVRGYGRNSTVPSLLPRNYAVGLAVYVVVVWALAGAAAVLAGLRAGRRRS